MAKVLIVTPWFPSPESPIRGIWVIDQARSLIPGHEVAILAFSPSPAAEGRFSVRDAVEDGIRILRIDYPPPQVPGLGLVAARAGTIEALHRLERAGFVPEIVHANTFLSAPAALTAGRRTGAPLVVVEHLTRITDAALSRAERLLARYTYRHADLVCPTSRPLAERMRGLGARGMVFTRNVLDTDQFSPRTGPRREGDIRALAAGSMNEKKGHRYLLEALAIARRTEPGLTLDLVGDGPLRPGLEAQAQALGIADAVRWHGYVDLDRLAQLMRDADLHVLPSLRENQPLVLAEAMATGIPTVGTEVGGVPEMLEGGMGVAVPRADPEALARAMLEVCGTLDSYDPERLAAVARERYGREAIGRQWSELFAGLLEGRS